MLNRRSVLSPTFRQNRPDVQLVAPNIRLENTMLVRYALRDVMRTLTRLPRAPNNESIHPSFTSQCNRSRIRMLSTNPQVDNRTGLWNNGQTEESNMTQPDQWGTASAAYAARTTYVTRPSAEQLISMVDEVSPLSHRDAIAFDNGAGSGVVTAALRARFADIPIVVADLSPGMLKEVERKQLPHVECQELDATNLHSIANDTFTHSLSTFMIQFAAEPLRALSEMYRVTKPGGTLGLGMWGELCFDAPWEDTVRYFEPGSTYQYPHTWTPDWQDENCLRQYIQAVGFKDVHLKVIRPRWDFVSLEEFSHWYLESKNPEFMRGYQPWWDKGMEHVMRPVFERILREKYGSARDFDMKVFLFTARK